MKPHVSLPKCVSSFSNACEIRKDKVNHGKRIVLTNGCFDLLHAGHVYSLQKAAALVEEVWVALNSDRSVRSLKGTTRPIYSEHERAYLLHSLGFVSLIFLFDSINLSNEILQLKPDVYAKSGDYTIDTINEKERNALKSVGAKICFVPFLEGYSTTRIINSIREKS